MDSPIYLSKSVGVVNVLIRHPLWNTSWVAFLTFLRGEISQKLLVLLALTISLSPPQLRSWVLCTGVALYISWYWILAILENLITNTACTYFAAGCRMFYNTLHAPIHLWERSKISNLLDVKCIFQVNGFLW